MHADTDMIAAVLYTYTTDDIQFANMHSIMCKI